MVDSFVLAFFLRRKGQPTLASAAFIGHRLCAGIPHLPSCLHPLLLFAFFIFVSCRAFAQTTLENEMEPTTSFGQLLKLRKAFSSMKDCNARFPSFAAHSIYLIPCSVCSLRIQFRSTASSFHFDDCRIGAQNSRHVREADEVLLVLTN